MRNCKNAERNVIVCSHPADDLLGHGLRDVLPADSMSEMNASLERAFAGASVSYERRERKSTGEMRWMRMTLFPDREVTGRTGGAFVVLNDIEDDVRIRDALKGQQAQLRLAAGSVADPAAAACPSPGSAPHGRRAEARSAHTGGIVGSQKTAAKILDLGAVRQRSR